MADITLREAYNRAKEALEAGEIDRAVAVCQHMLRYYPRYVEGYRLLGEAYLERGGWAEAGRLFSHVLSCDPQNVLSHVGRAIIAEEQRLIDIAISELERGFEIDPSIGELRAELLRLYKERYGTAGAFIRTTPIGLAYTHLRAGLLEQAIVEFMRSSAATPNRWDSRVALLEALWRNEQLIDAARLAGEILVEHPNCVKANWILGYLHWTQGKLSTGREYLTAAVALDPDYGIARKLWANTPWPLDPAVTREQPAPIANWVRGELIVEEDLDLALPLPLSEEPLTAAPPPPIYPAPDEAGAEAGAEAGLLAAATADTRPQAETPADTEPVVEGTADLRAVEAAIPKPDLPVLATPAEGSLPEVAPADGSAPEAPPPEVELAVGPAPEAPPPEVELAAAALIEAEPAPVTASLMEAEPAPVNTPTPVSDWLSEWARSAAALLPPTPAAPAVPPADEVGSRIIEAAAGGDAGPLPDLPVDGIPAAADDTAAALGAITQEQGTEEAAHRPPAALPVAVAPDMMIPTPAGVAVPGAVPVEHRLDPAASRPDEEAQHVGLISSPAGPRPAADPVHGDHPRADSVAP
jgi:tetratricopeptide (TPR) repeat protein